MPSNDPHSRSDYSLSTRQIADMLRCSPDKVRRWIQTGQLPAIDIGNGSRPQWRVSEEALRGFLDCRACCAIRKSQRRRRQPAVKQFV